MSRFPGGGGSTPTAHRKEGELKLQAKDRRVQRFVARHRKAPAFRWQDMTDPRDRRGRRWELGQLLDAAFDGMLAGCRTLRDVEALTEELGGDGRGRVPRRVPDTTLYEVLEDLSIEELRGKLRQQVRTLWRAKSVEPQGLPCGVMSVDGKTIGVLEHDADGTAQKSHSERRPDGRPYWLARVLRAALTSSAARVALDQAPVPPETNEMGTFASFFDALVESYDPLFEVVTVDAGLTSRAHADRIHAADKAYVMAIKGPQPELLAEAKRLLDPRQKEAPDAETPWERASGKEVRRRLWRTAEIAGYHDWTHLQQAWRIAQETRSSDGNVEVEERYFLTSLRPGRLTPTQSLLVVRGHWGIENDCFWSLDMQWREDDGPWSTRGRAVEVLGLLRLMAYNLLQLVRKRHLRERRPDGELAAPPAWRRVFEWVRQALRLPARVDPIPDNG